MRARRSICVRTGSQSGSGGFRGKGKWRTGNDPRVGGSRRVARLSCSMGFVLIRWWGHR